MNPASPLVRSYYYDKSRSLDDPLIFWAHGWARDHTQFMTLIENFPISARHIAFDFPGFGQASRPPSAWSSEEYAEDVLQWMQGYSLEGEPLLNSSFEWQGAMKEVKKIWIGYSFGGRLGLILGAKLPLDGLILMASAGIRLPLSWQKKLRIVFYKVCSRYFKPIFSEQKWKFFLKKFASSDYFESRALRKTLVRVVNEDLSHYATKIKAPTLLIYGREDIDTPLQVARKLRELIPNSSLKILNHFDHHTIVTSGIHQLLWQIQVWIENRLKSR